MVSSPHASYPHERSYSWPWIFFINVPLAIFVTPIAGMLMTKVDPRRLVCFGMLWIAAVSRSAACWMA